MRSNLNGLPTCFKQKYLRVYKILQLKIWFFDLRKLSSDNYYVKLTERLKEVYYIYMTYEYEDSQLSK